jgi:selenocysteine lyase/cysteine desulfurase
VRVLTPLDGKQAGGIALFNVDGIDSAKLQGWLWAKHRIITTPIIHPEFQGLRITPNVYTTLDEVDRFGDKVLEAVARGVNA